MILSLDQEDVVAVPVSCQLGDFTLLCTRPMPSDLLIAESIAWPFRFLVWKQTIVQWDGVKDKDGNDIQFTRSNLEKLLAKPEAFAAIANAIGAVFTVSV